MAANNGGAGAIGTIMGVAFIGLLFGFLSGWFTRVDAPKISVDGGVTEKDIIEVEMPWSENGSIYFRIGSDTADVSKAKAEFYFNDGIISETDKCGQGCWKISAKRLKVGTTYTVRAKNTAGEDTAKVKIIARKQTTSSKPYDERRTTTHVLCKRYAERYFYPLKVKLHDIAGVRHDAETPDGSWKYNLYVTTTNAAGSKQKHIVDCVVGNFSNGNTSGEVLSFDTMLAQ